MTKLCVCGSFRFTHQMSELATRLEEESVEYWMSRKIDSQGILGCFEKIDKTDVVYVVNPEGYVGKSVCVDIGYAYAKNKPIFVMNPIHDPSIMDLIRDVLSFEELIDFLKRDDAAKHE